MLTAGSLSSGALSAFAAMPAAASASLSPQSTMEKMNDALAQLDGLVNDEMKGSGIPGVGIAVVYNDKTMYAKGFGVRQVGKPDAVDADTVFQLASVSKPIGATVIAALVEAEAVSWDSRISKMILRLRCTTPG